MAVAVLPAHESRKSPRECASAQVFCSKEVKGRRGRERHPNSICGTPVSPSQPADGAHPAHRFVMGIVLGSFAPQRCGRAERSFTGEQEWEEGEGEAPERRV